MVKLKSLTCLPKYSYSKNQECFSVDTEDVQYNILHYITFTVKKSQDNKEHIRSKEFRGHKMRIGHFSSSLNITKMATVFFQPKGEIQIQNLVRRVSNLCSNQIKSKQELSTEMNSVTHIVN